MPGIRRSNSPGTSIIFDFGTVSPLIRCVSEAIRLFHRMFLPYDSGGIARRYRPVSLRRRGCCFARTCITTSRVGRASASSDSPLRSRSRVMGPNVILDTNLAMTPWEKIVNGDGTVKEPVQKLLDAAANA